MKRNVMVSILCAILVLSAASLAEPVATEAVFDDFTLVLDQVSTSDMSLSVSLSAVFESEEAALAYEVLPVLEGQTEPEADQGMTLYASFKTPAGDPFFAEETFDYWEFGAYSEPQAQEDGTWRREILLYAEGATDEDTLVMGFSVYDPSGDTPYTGEDEQTIDIGLSVE